MLIWPHSGVALVSYGSPDLRSLAHNFLILLYYCIHLAHLNLALICLNLLLKVNCSEKNNVRLKNITSCTPGRKCHSFNLVLPRYSWHVVESSDIIVILSDVIMLCHISAYSGASKIKM